ncbi:hypothetical protein O6H91_12G102000 [Diphasiastrum complanatum]|nr:hypothetical protein O6H91_12G102000 [Diphasiastrum complanatum]
MQLFAAMEQNFPMWANTFAPLVVGADFPAAVEEFSRTVLGIQAGVAVHVAKLIFLGDYRSILPAVTVPCHVIQTQKDFAVPGNVAKYLHRRLGGRHSTLDILETEGHLPQISAPTILAPILVKLITHQQGLI